MNAQVTETNFFKGTKATFVPTEIPEGKADYVSLRPDGGVSSLYYYTPEGVIRVSNHWGADIRTCSWHLEGGEGFDNCVTYDSEMFVCESCGKRHAEKPKSCSGCFSHQFEIRTVKLFFAMILAGFCKWEDFQDN